MSFSRSSSESERRARLEAICEKLERRYPDLPTVEVDEVPDSGNAKGAVLVDVRSPEERRVSRIPGAISREELEEDLEEYRGRRLVAYCTVGGRSSSWADEMRRRGWDAANLRGSILAWTHAGRDLENDDGTTRRVHVKGRRWNLAADGYEPVW